MTKKKTTAPKTEPKQKVIVDEVAGKYWSPSLEKWVDIPEGGDVLVDTNKIDAVSFLNVRFKPGEIIKNENRLYKCVAINGNELAIFAPYSKANTRVKYEGMFAVDNGELKNDTFQFERIQA